MYQFRDAKGTAEKNYPIGGFNVYQLGHARADLIYW